MSISYSIEIFCSKTQVSWSVITGPHLEYKLQRFTADVHTVETPPTREELGAHYGFLVHEMYKNNPDLHGDIFAIRSIECDLSKSLVERYRIAAAWIIRFDGMVLVGNCWTKPTV
jgi:hypothetical protein